MKLTITIKLDNAAFDSYGETARILRKLADRYAEEPDHELSNPINLFDVNGNKVGRVTLED
jgi:hypothetical protein